MSKLAITTTAAVTAGIVVAVPAMVVGAMVGGSKGLQYGAVIGFGIGAVGGGIAGYKTATKIEEFNKTIGEEFAHGIAAKFDFADVDLKTS